MRFLNKRRDSDSGLDGQEVMQSPPRRGLFGRRSRQTATDAGTQSPPGPESGSKTESGVGTEFKAPVKEIEPAARETEPPVSDTQGSGKSGRWLPSFRSPLSSSSTDGGKGKKGSLVIERKQEVGPGDPKRQQELYAACKDGDVEAVRKLIAGGCDLNAKTYGRFLKTPLHMAAKYGNDDVVKLLLGLDPAPSPDTTVAGGRDPGGEKGTKVVAEEEVEEITDKGHSGESGPAAEGRNQRAAVNARDGAGKTALHDAAESGYAKVVESLLEAGADAGLRDNSGCTALHRAAERGHLEVVEALLRGVGLAAQKKTTRSLVLSSEMTTVFSLVVAKGSDLSEAYNTAKAARLKAKEDAEKKASLEAQNKAETAALPEGEITEAAQPITKDISDTPMQPAAKESGDTPIQPTAKESGGTPIQSTAKESGDTPIQPTAKESGDTQMQPTAKESDDTQMQPTAKASSDTPAPSISNEGPRRAEALKVKSNASSGDLLRAKDNAGKIELLRIKDKAGKTALHRAAIGDSVGVIQALLQAAREESKPASGQGEEGGSSHAAATVTGEGNAETEGSREALRKLNQGADYVDLADNDGRTALFCAAERRRAGIVTELLSAGANIAPEHVNVAAGTGDEDILKRFLKKLGGRPLSTIRDESGKTPLHSAAEQGQLNIVKLLVEKDETRTKELEQNPEPGKLTPSRTDSWNTNTGTGRRLSDANPATGSSSGSKSAMLRSKVKSTVGTAAAIGAAKLKSSARPKKPEPPLVNSRTAENLTPLDLAALEGKPVVVDYLLSKGADPTIKGRDGLTALDRAFIGSDGKVIDLILSKLEEDEKEEGQRAGEGN